MSKLNQTSKQEMSFKEVFYEDEVEAEKTRSIESVIDNAEKNSRINNVQQKISALVKSSNDLKDEFNSHYNKAILPSALLLLISSIWSITISDPIPLALGLFSAGFFMVAFRGFMEIYVQNVVYMKKYRVIQSDFKDLRKQLVEEYVGGKIIGHFDDDLDDDTKWHKVTIVKNKKQENYMIRFSENDQGIAFFEFSKLAEDS